MNLFHSVLFCKHYFIPNHPLMIRSQSLDFAIRQFHVLDQYKILVRYFALEWKLGLLLNKESADKCAFALVRFSRIVTLEGAPAPYLIQSRIKKSKCKSFITTFLITNLENKHL